MGKTIKWIALLALVLAVTFGVEAACQLPLLTGNGGVKAISLDAVSVEGGSEAAEEEIYDEFAEEEYFEDEFFEEEYSGEEDWADEAWDEEEFLDEEGAATEISAQAGQQIVIAYEGYVQTLTIQGETGSENAAYTVRCTLKDGSEYTAESFFWIMGEEPKDSVTIGRDVTSMTLTFPATSSIITALEADNRFMLNPYRMLLSALATLCVGLLVLLRKTIGRRAEVGFLIVGLCVGLILSIGQPATTGNTYDDEIHYGRIAALSHGRPGYLTEAESLLTERGFSVLYDESYHYEADTWQDQQRFLAALNKAGENQEIALDVPLQLAFSDTGYVLQALGHGLARLAGLPLSMQLIMARVFNMLSYVLLVFLGIRTLKRFKIALSVIALMPTPMFLACSLTYDTTINALCFLGTALAVEAILDRNTRLSWQRGLGILLAMVLGAVSKVVYIPLLLLVLLLPRSKFDSASARISYKTLAVILCVLLVMTMMLSVSQGAVSLTDSRGDGADSASQISYLLHNPFAYLMTFLRTIWEGFDFYFISGTRTFLGYAGAPMGSVLNILSLVLVILGVVTDNDAKLGQRVNWKQRIAMFIIGMMAVGMTFTTMYVAYTGVGADYISGVQGRYLIPTLPLLAMICSPDWLKNRLNKTAWHTVVFLLNGAVLLAVCWQMFAQYYL